MPPRPPPPSTPPRPAAPLAVTPGWLLKGLGLTILAALVCGYGTLCLLFYQGQWQLILHPRRTDRPITSFGAIVVQPVRFSAGESGIPQLAGALIPATPGMRYTPYTVLYLRGGDLSLGQSSVDARNIALLHGLGLSVFAFDYRGYGESTAIHPTQARMLEDADAAFAYLAAVRAVPESRIVLYGQGVGTSFAAHLAAAHLRAPALILDSPGTPPLAIAMADPRTRALPVRILFHERFPLNPLTTLKTPKLLISYREPGKPESAAFPPASDPKMTLDLVSGDPKPLSTALSRFLEENLHP